MSRDRDSEAIETREDYVPPLLGRVVHIRLDGEDVTGWNAPPMRAACGLTSSPCGSYGSCCTTI